MVYSKSSNDRYSFVIDSDKYIMAGRKMGMKHIKRFTLILIFVATILLSQAFCLYISNAQQRFIALKAISGIVAFAATIILILHYVYPRTEFFYGIIYPQKSGVLIDKKIILMLIFLLVEIWLTIFLWRKSYKMFKSSQITNSINNK